MRKLSEIALVSFVVVLSMISVEAGWKKKEDCPYKDKCDVYGHCIGSYYEKYGKCYCKCDSGYYGTCCEYEPVVDKKEEYCDPYDCDASGYGYCEYYDEKTGDCYCKCEAGYYGPCCQYKEVEKKVEKKEEYCFPYDCEKYAYGYCEYYDDKTGDCYCKCEAGYYGPCCQYKEEHAVVPSDQCVKVALCEKNGHCNKVYYGDYYTCDCDCNIGFIGKCCDIKIDENKDCDETPQCLCCVDGTDIQCDCVSDFSKGVPFKKCGKRLSFTAKSCGDPKGPNFIAFDSINKEICDTLGGDSGDKKPVRKFRGYSPRW